jgi:hypothetical protein
MKYKLKNGQEIQFPIYRKLQFENSCIYIKVDENFKQVSIGIGFGYDPESRRYEYKKHVLNYPPSSFYDGTGDYEICDRNEFQDAIAIILGSIEAVDES